MKLHRMASTIKTPYRHVFFDKPGVADRVYRYIIEMEGALPEHYKKNGFNAVAQAGVSSRLLSVNDFFDGFSGVFFFSEKLMNAAKDVLLNDCTFCPCNVKHEHGRHRLYMPVLHNRIELFFENGNTMDKTRLSKVPENMVLAREKSRPFIFLASDHFRAMAEKMAKGIAFTEINDETRF
jgi:hypothetical protein